MDRLRRFSGGKTALRGIRELLLGAHALTAVQDSSPLQEYGIYRLLTAIVMDMCRLRGPMDMEALLENGHFYEAQVDAYIARCERDGPCFDLFDKKGLLCRMP